MRLFYTLVFIWTSIFQQNIYAKSNRHSPKTSILISNLKNKYPNAKVQYVSLNKYQEIKEGYVPKDTSKKKNKTIRTDKNPCDSPMKYYGRSSRSVEKKSKKEKQITVGNNLNISSNNGKDVLIIIAVIGVVSVAALVIYSGRYIYESLTGSLKCKAWDEWGLRYSSINDNSETQNRNGSLKGLYYSNTHYVPTGTMGLSAELGTFQLDLKVLDKPNSKLNSYNGSYIMLGPAFTFPIAEKHFFNLELLAGTSSSKDIGLLSTIRFGYSIRFSKTVSINLGIGAAYVKLKGLEGLLGHNDDINFLSGFQISLY